MKPLKTINQIITDKILNLLTTAGQYKKKWINTKNGFAVNPFSDTIYEGLNQLLLSIYIDEGDFKVNKWLTFLQASELNGKILKGSKSFQLVHYNYTYKLRNGKKVSSTVFDKLTKEEKIGATKNGFLNYFNVFNVAQIEGLDETFYKIEDLENRTFLPIEKMENLANDYVSISRVKLLHAAQNRAYYAPGLDSILMPLKEQYISSEAYYKTLFHEFSHSTGHESRLNRESITSANETNELYAFEELIAELSSAFINARFGLETEISENATYINYWLKALKNDSNAFIKASSKANKSANYILSITNQFKKAA